MIHIEIKWIGFLYFTHYVHEKKNETDVKILNRMWTVLEIKK